MEGSVLSYVTDHNDAADDEDAHLGDCEASAIRGYPLVRGLSRRPRNAPLATTSPGRQIAAPAAMHTGRIAIRPCMPNQNYLTP